MHFYFLFTLFALMAVCLAKKKRDDDTTTTATTTSQTSVYVTVTRNGQTTVIQTAYSQSFMPTYASVTGTVSSGGVGMGSLSGSVGGVRSYSQTTVGHSNAAPAMWKPENLYAGAIGLAFVAVGGLL